MSKRKPRYQRKGFESIVSDTSDTSANIYLSMLVHPNFLALNPKQKTLYLYCKAQYYGQSGKKSADATDQTKFYFNRELWQNEYKLYNKGNERAFYKDIQALIDYGFIRKIESGKCTRTKNIYQLSSEWQQIK